MSARLTFDELADMAAGLSRVDIACHRSPDADTLGSALALFSVINANGGDAEIKCADRVGERLRFLIDGRVGNAVTINSEFRAGAERISVDVASVSQLGSLWSEDGEYLFMIDHHPDGDGRFAPCLTDTTAAANGEIIFDLIEKMTARGVWKNVPRDTWTYLFAAISGDTGSFCYGNTTAKTHTVASELIKRGADFELCSFLLHKLRFEREAAAEALAVSAMKRYCGGRLAVSTLSSRAMSAAGLESSDFGAISDIMRCYDGVLVGASVRESKEKEGEWRVSLRANVPVDCASVAKRFGGGGHTQAAGFNVAAESAISAEKITADAVSEAIREYEKSTEGHII
ncbi:MAG: DHHA1 domain-containing protein [Firmicutes bacterium]|nr:DHHA1 domain-containing protein [Bacillota bacterium]